MKTQKTHPARQKGAMVLLLLLVLANSAFAQSTDRANPTPLDSNEIQGAGVTQKTSYYYSFEGGPGEVTATLEAKMKSGAADSSISLDILDTKHRNLASTALSQVSKSSKQRIAETILGGLNSVLSEIASRPGKTANTASVSVEDRQPLLLRLTIGTGVQSYTVRLDGAVGFAPAEAEATAEAAPAELNTPAAETPAGMPAEDQPAPEEQTATLSDAPPVEDTSPIPGSESQKPPAVMIPTKKTQTGIITTKIQDKVKKGAVNVNPQ